MRNLVKYAGIGLLWLWGLRPVITTIQSVGRSAKRGTKIKPIGTGGWQTQFLTAGGYDRPKRQTGRGRIICVLFDRRG